MPDETELQLVRAAQGGDQSAFGVLVRRYQNAVGAVAYALTGQIALSEDIAQETFVLTWRRFDKVQPEHLRSWLLAVARRTSYRALRDQRTALRESGVSAAVAQLPSSDPSPLERAIDHEEEAVVWHALRRIPESYRIPLVLFYREQQSLDRVAEVLALSSANVRMRLTRGRRMLQQQVVELVESTLRRSRLGKSFTAAMAALVAGGAGGTGEASPRGSPGKLTTRDAWLAGAVAGVVLVVAAALAMRPGERARASREAIGQPERAAPGSSFRLAPKFQLGGWGETGQQMGDMRSSSSRTREIPVLGFDFEDGLLPQEFFLGHVVPTPGRPGNRYAAMATALMRDWGPIDLADREFMRGFAWPTAVVLEPTDLHYRGTLVLTFDCLTDDQRAGTLEIWNSDRRSNYFTGIKPKLGRWTRFTVPLSSLRPRKDVGAMEPGDRLSKISVYLGQMGGPPLLIDDVRIVDSGGNGEAAVGQHSGPG